MLQTASSSRKVGPVPHHKTPLNLKRYSTRKFYNSSETVEEWSGNLKYKMLHLPRQKRVLCCKKVQLLNLHQLLAIVTKVDIILVCLVITWKYEIDLYFHWNIITGVLFFQGFIFQHTYIHHCMRQCLVTSISTVAYMGAYISLNFEFAILQIAQGCQSGTLHICMKRVGLHLYLSFTQKLAQSPLFVFLSPWLTAEGIK